MNDLLSVYQVARLFDLIEQAPNVSVPVFENALGGFIGLLKCNTPLKPINLGRNTFVNDHVAQFLLGPILGDTDQFRQCLDVDAAIVSLNNPEIVLNQLPEELPHMRLMVLSDTFLKRVILGHRSLDLLFI